MKASETQLQPLLEGTKQYQVPLFQRPYRWTTKDWDVLWQDLLDLYDGPDQHEHFMGAIVTMPTEQSPHGTNKYLLIDGQQRLTTLFVLLACVRDLARSAHPDHAEEIEALYLFNQFKKETDRQKLLPTQLDRASFADILEGRETELNSPLGKAKSYFRRKLISARDKHNAPLNLRRLQNILLQRIMVVSIVLHRDENPYRIFESLNGKGQPLTQADLVRNYMFMRIPDLDDQNVAYRDVWLPIEERLNGELTNFFWRYLTKDGTFVRQDQIYEGIKSRVAGLSPDRVPDELLDMHRYSGYYQRLVAPDHEPNLSIRHRMHRLNLWEVNTAYPFLLKLYDDYERGIVSAESMCATLDMIESYVVRRFFCREPTNTLNRMFIALYAQIDPENVVGTVEEELLKRNWPDDATFVQEWCRFPIYTSGVKKCRHVLEALEMELTENDEPVDLRYKKISIEHIMPQTLNEAWEEHLGQRAGDIHSAYLHTIGNLTLTGKNGPMGNQPFSVKRDVFARSSLALNHDLASLKCWNEHAIWQRAEALSEAALRIWRRSASTQSATNPDDPTGKKPTKFELFGQEHSVQKWREVLQQVCALLAQRHGERFALVAPQIVGERRRYIVTEPTVLVVPAQVPGTDLWLEVNVSSREVLRVVRLLLDAFGHNSTDFRVYFQ